MDQRTFTAVFVVLVVVVVIGMAIVKISSEGQSVIPSPSPGINPIFQSGSDLPAPQSNQNNQQPPQNQIKQYKAFPGVYPADQLKNKRAVIETNKGSIEFEIYPEATKAASNFIFLSMDHFYDGLFFHRVEDWVIQTGDPTAKGSGGPGYKFEDEPVSLPYEKGVVAMANSGPNTNGSQFFILTKDTPLEPKYTIFGKVLSGQEIADKIKVGDYIRTISILPLQ